MIDYEYPRDNDNVGECEECHIIRPLHDGICKQCMQDIHAEAERDARRDEAIDKADAALDRWKDERYESYRPGYWGME